MAMFEREIRFIYDFNLNRVKKLGSYLTFEQLVSAEIHPAILQYISAEIDFLIFEDRQKLLKDSVFDYSGKNIAGLFNQIDDEIKKTKKFSLEYINKILLHSTSFTINYLVRPRWTLSQFLFDNENEKNSTEIKQILNYVYFYSYLKDTLISYLDKKKLVSITRADFDTLLAKVDKLGVDTYLPTIIDTSIKSISEVFNIGSVQSGKFPLQAIEIFLGEKELHTHLQKLHEVFPGDPRPKVSTSDLRNLLLDVEHVDLTFDPYMEEETIEEESIPEKESTEFEEFQDQEEIIESEPDKVEEKEFDPNSFIEESLNDYNKEEPNEQIEESAEENLPVDEFDQKLNDVISEITKDDNEEVIEEIETDAAEVVIPVAKEDQPESEDEDFEEEPLNDKLDAAVEEKFVEDSEPEIDQNDFEEIEENVDAEEEIIEEEFVDNRNSEFDMEEEALEDVLNSEEEPIERKQKEIKSGDTTITINYPEGYEPESADNEKDENIEEEILEVENANTESYEEELEVIEESGDDIVNNIEKEESIEDNLEIEEIEETIDSEIVEDEIEPIVKKELEHPLHEDDDFPEEIDEDEANESASETFEEAIEEVDENAESILQTIKEERVDELIVDTDLDSTELVEDSEITEEVFDEENNRATDEIPEEIEEDNSNTRESVLEDEPVEPESDLQKNETLDEPDSNSELDEEPELFPRDEVKVSDEDEKTEYEEDDYYSAASRIDITELLENKNMTKIIKVVFDYDMEDFANTIEQVSECKNKEEADEILEKLYKTNRVKPTSKEAGAFNDIIAEYFASEG